MRGDIPMYDGNLKEEDLLDSIASMDTYFEGEEDGKVKGSYWQKKNSKGMHSYGGIIRRKTKGEEVSQRFSLGTR